MKGIIIFSTILCSLYWQTTFFTTLIHLSFPKVSEAYDSSNFTVDYPTAFSKNNRILGMILAFNHYHIDPIILLLNEYVSMCEAGWSPTVVFFTAVHWSPTLFRYFRQKSFCYRINSHIDIRSSEHDPSINVGLGAQHRPYMANELNNFDLFLYHEDDMWFKLSHVTAYLNEIKKLHELMPVDGLMHHTIGFQRYRRLSRGNDVHHGFGEQDIFEQELLEEMPNFNPVCLNSQPYIHVTGNIHQAVWMFTRQQVIMLQEKCSFLNQSSPSREFMSSFSIFDHKPHYCSLNKLLPPERLMTFAVLHYYQQRHVSWTPVFVADENIRAGFSYTGRQNINVPECWNAIVTRVRKEQEEGSKANAPASRRLRVDIENF